MRSPYQMVQIRPLLIGHFDLSLLIQYGFIRGTVNNTDKKEKRDTLTLTLSFISSSSAIV